MKRNIEYRFEQKVKHGEKINAIIYTENGDEIQFIGKGRKKEKQYSDKKVMRKMMKEYQDNKRIESIFEELDE